MKIASRLHITPSATVRMNGLALEKRARGERVYNLSAGEPMLPPHPAVIVAATRALAEGKTLYPPVAGIPELREAFTRWMNETYHTGYSARQCIITCGGKFGIYAAFQALLNPGDEVIVLAPYWVSYTTMAEMFSGLSVVVATREEKGWKALPEDIERVASSKARMLIINNAANPTGALYTREELRSLLAYAAQRDIVVLSDEVYSGLVYDGQEFVSCGSFPEFRDSVIVVQSCSKHFAMTGWRVGVVASPEAFIETLIAIQSQSTTGTASISQWAALGALKNADSVIATVRAAMEDRRDAFTKTFNDLFRTNIRPVASGLYSFIPMSSLGTPSSDSTAFCEALLEHGNIASVPGAAFGQEGYVRFSFGATKAEIVEALQVMEKFLGAS